MSSPVYLLLLFPTIAVTASSVRNQGFARPLGKPSLFLDLGGFGPRQRV
jgi:hypothetical protein